MSEPESIDLHERKTLSERNLQGERNPLGERSPILDRNPLSIRNPDEPHPVPPRPRAMGLPLSMGLSRNTQYPVSEASTKRLTPPPPGRSLGGAPEAADEPSSLARTVSALRTALPFVQRLLPLLDGTMTAAVSSLLTPHAQPHPPAAPTKVGLEPVEHGISELQSQQNQLKAQVAEQNNSIKRVEDQLELVREATDRNTLEQQELLEDLKAFSNGIKIVAIITLGLVAVGLALTVALLMHVNKVLP
jgi:hypothetical protein